MCQIGHFTPLTLFVDCALLSILTRFYNGICRNVHRPVNVSNLWISEFFKSQHWLFLCGNQTKRLREEKFWKETHFLFCPKTIFPLTNDCPSHSYITRNIKINEKNDRGLQKGKTFNTGKD